MKQAVIQRKIAILTLLLIVGFLTISPVFMLILGSFSKGLGTYGQFTLEKYIKAYSDPSVIQVISDTVLFAFGSAIFATLLAIFLSYINIRTNVPLKSIFHIISIAPIMIPHIIFAVSWVILFNPSNGLVNIAVSNTFNLRGPLFNIYTLPGMILVEGLLDLPVAYLIISPATSSFDASLEEASRMSGASNLETLRRVTLPILRPAILASIILVVVRSFAAFSVPATIGMPGRIYVLTTHIYRIIARGFMPDYGMAAAVGVSLLATSIVLAYLYRYMTARAEKYMTVSGRGYRPSLIDLGKYKYILFAVVFLILVIMIIMPIIVIFYTSLLPYYMLPSWDALKMASLNNWVKVLSDPISFGSLENSVFLAVLGATLGVLLSMFIAYSTVKIRFKGSGILDSLTFLSFSFPGMVIGIGFMWAFVRTPLYATIWALLLGYIAVYMPYGVRPLTSTVIQIHNELEESSRICGASSLYTLRRITMPLLTSGILSGWILLASQFTRELSVSVVLSRPGSEVLAVQILRFLEDGRWGELSALGILMVIICTSLVILASRLRARVSHVTGGL